VGSPDEASGARPDGSDGFSARAIAVLNVIGVGFVLVLQLLLLDPSAPKEPHYNGAWNPPESRAELLVAKMDGHAFAQTAEDPFLQHTLEDYSNDPVNAAYRASRPFPGWVYSVASLGGQRPLLAPVILVITALSIGFVVWALDLLGRALDVQVRLLGSVAALPAVVAAIAYPGISEPMGLGLSLSGLALWFRHRTAAAVACFAAAALCRETMLLVPLGLALSIIVERRSLRPALPLAIPAAAYVGWVALVHARFGELPSSYSPMAAPFTGLAEAISYWHLAEWLTAALLAASGVAIVRWGPRWMQAILAVHLLFFTTMSTIVWWVWWGFGRVGTILPLLALVAWSSSRSPAPAAGRAPSGADALAATPAPA